MDWSALREKLLGKETQSIVPPSVKLPMLPRALMEFNQMAENPDVITKDLAAVIESDAGLTCELLKSVNSAACGLRQKVSSAAQAISLLGLKTTKVLLTTSAVKSAMSTRESKLINLQNFWNTNFERALLAKEIARILQADEDIAFAAGMLQDFLLPILTSESLETYLDFTTQQETSPVNLYEFEQQVFGWDHALAAAYVMRDWGFPDDLICCVAMHNKGLFILKDAQLASTCVAAVALAGLMPDALRQTPDGLDQLIRLEKAWPKFNLLKIASQVENDFHESSPSSAANWFSLRHRSEKALADIAESVA